MPGFCHILLITALYWLPADDAAIQETEQAQALVQPATADQAAQNLIAQLGSPVFETRRRAFLQLWNAGTAVQPALQSAREKLSALSNSADSRQLTESLDSLELLLELGVSADAEQDPLRLVELLSEIDPRKLVQICELGYWDLATQLVVNNTTLHDALSDAYGRYTLNQIVDLAFERGDLTLAWPIVCASTPTSQMAWIANKLPTFDLPIADGETLDQQASRLFYGGQVDEALQLVLSPRLRALMLTRSFQWNSFLDEQLQLTIAGAQRDVAQLAARAVLTEIGGDPARADALWAELLADSQTFSPPEEDSEQPVAQPDASPIADDAPSDEAGNPQVDAALRRLFELNDPITGNADQSNQFLVALLMSGRVEAVEKYLAGTNQLLAFTFLVDRNHFGQALELLGLQPNLGNLDAWIAEQRVALPAALKRGSRMELEVVARTAAVLIGLGYQPQAVKILNMLAELARDEPKFEVPIWIETIVRRLGRHESRALCLRIAEANYPQMSAQCQERILEDLHPELGRIAPQLFACAPALAGLARIPPGKAWRCCVCGIANTLDPRLRR